MPSTSASCLAISVLPTPVGPVSRKEPTGLLASRRPARATLMAETRRWMGSSWPKTTAFSSLFQLAELLLSFPLTWRAGIWAMMARTSSRS